MRTRWLVVPVFVSLLALPSAASAQGRSAGKSTAKKSAAGVSPDGVRRDPKGIKGISPFEEALKRGDDAYVARNFDGAIEAFRDAITKEPQNAMGHYLMGEAQLAKGNTQEANAAWAAALRFVKNDYALKAKILFVLADLRERQKSYDDATDLWTRYEALAKAHPDVKMFPESAVQRKKVIATWKQLLVDYGAVKKRIALRLKEAEKKAKKSAR